MESSFHTFSPREAEKQRRFAAWRSRALAPVLQWLHAVGVTPDALTVTGIVAIMFFPLGFVSSPLYAIIAYVVHVILDGLDGALARHMGTSSPRGSYLDIIADHVPLLVIVLTLQWFGIGHPFWVLLYTVCYLLLIVHAVVMNLRNQQHPLALLRTRHVLFVLTVLLLYGLMEILFLDLFFVMFGLYYAFMLLIYIVSFRWSLSAS